MQLGSPEKKPAGPMHPLSKLDEEQKPMQTSFPPGFTWGAATASYQIEGAWKDDGKGESIWDRFCRTPGKVLNGDTGDVACDHYHRWSDDIGLMKSLGLQAYRFSISWPRILPQGSGRKAPAGLVFYSRLVDGLLAAGIEPFVTLYHWDMPQSLEDRGGWPARDTAQAFAEYTEVVVRRLGDRVKRWITLNEPWVSAFLGYDVGMHAPGRRDKAQAVAAAHHLLLAHGWAVPVIRRDSTSSQVGITLNLSPQAPASPSDADRLAARQEDGTLNRWFLDPIMGCRYPQDIVEYYNARYKIALAFDQPGDQDAMGAQLDFLGVNYYTRGIARSEEISESKNEPRTVFPNPHRTEMGWEVYPEGLHELLTWLHKDYAFPAYYITENGAAYRDQLRPDGRVDDPERIAYLREHFKAAAQAIAEGVPLKGYFVWSLLDNFEWALGYTRRFGIVYVDYPTEQRIPKASAHWYGKVIDGNAVTE
jgi:beta-glucosidase